METENIKDYRNALMNMKERANEPTDKKVRSIRPKPPLAEIEAALDRLDNGTYGICNTCYTFMPRRDLLDEPHRTACSRCMSRSARRAA